jgi:hypothetical protein
MILVGLALFAVSAFSKKSIPLKISKIRSFLSRAKELKKFTPTRAPKDDEEYELSKADEDFLECVADADLDLESDGEVSTSNEKAVGKCCGKNPLAEVCVEMGQNCAEYYSTPGASEILGDEEEYTKAKCSGFCSGLKKKPFWCPKGLSAGAIAGIVIACLVVVGAAVGAAVFFLVIKKSGD